MADALYTVDYDDSWYATLTEVYQEANRKIIEFTDSLLGMVLRRCMITFDFNDFRTFLQFPTPSKHIDFFMLAGGVIPAQDYDFLYKAGVAAIFGPGTSVAKAACQILEILLDE
jgi:methylmalonyl-CoA mutase cobalamin-binding domain/chain